MCRTHHANVDRHMPKYSMGVLQPGRDIFRFLSVRVSRLSRLRRFHPYTPATRLLSVPNTFNVPSTQHQG